MLKPNRFAHGGMGGGGGGVRVTVKLHTKHFFSLHGFF